MLETTHKTTYAIADPHGCLDVLKQALSVVDLSGDAHLYLLGDYIPHFYVNTDPAKYAAQVIESLEFVCAYERAHPHKVSVLAGNHEVWVLNQVDLGELYLERDLLRWVKGLPYYLETERQFFVHAGVDEEAGEYWRWGTEDSVYFMKHPATFGAFEKDIIAGHVGAPGLAGNHGFEGIFWDGQSHYFLDATTEKTGRINVLIYDAERGVYRQRIATADGVSGILSIDNNGHLV